MPVCAVTGGIQCATNCGGRALYTQQRKFEGRREHCGTGPIVCIVDNVDETFFAAAFGWTATKRRQAVPRTDLLRLTLLRAAGHNCAPPGQHGAKCKVRDLWFAFPLELEDTALRSGARPPAALLEAAFRRPTRTDIEVGKHVKLPEMANVKVLPNSKEEAAALRKEFLAGFQALAAAN